MALDTGSTTHLLVAQPLGPARGPAGEAFPSLGAWLLAVRESRGDTLSALSDSTRIRVSHLKAIEADDFLALPSRPFAVGYVRAYARALGLDGEAAVAPAEEGGPGGSAGAAGARRRCARGRSQAPGALCGRRRAAGRGSALEYRPAHHAAG